MPGAVRAPSEKRVYTVAMYNEDGIVLRFDDTVAVSTVASRLGRKTIELDHVCKAFGERTVIDDFSYTVLRDDRIGVIGPNGAGKSTLLKLLAGILPPDSGHVDIGATVRIGYFTQEGR